MAHERRHGSHEVRYQRSGMAKAACQRRILAALEWIHSIHAEAKVSLGGTEWGLWQGLQPSWQLHGNRIQLRLRGPGRIVVCWVSGIHVTASGVEIKISRGLNASQSLRVSWMEASDGAQPGHDLLQAVRIWLQSMLPGCRLLSVSQAPDRAHSLSGKYLRMRWKHGARDHFLLASSESEDEAQIAPILTQSLLWLACLRAKNLLHTTPTVYLLVPRGRSIALCHRAGLVNPDRARIEVWEYRGGVSRPWESHRPGPPSPPVEDRDFRWPILGPFRWSALLARVIDLAPTSIQRYPRFQDYDSLRLMGLEFARAMGSGRDHICFGVGSQQVELNENNFEDLRNLVNQILFYRRADSPAIEHPYYRMQAERWLESLLLNEAAFLFPELIPGSIYPQIPVYLGRIPGRVDILAADRAGNLVVMELKVTEDPDLPLQSLDYWGRVIGHNLNGDFERRGYFAGLRLSRARPKMYLVAPVFTFHDSLERILRCLDPGLEVTKIALNEDWRCGVRILNRTDYRCGELD
jgi:hypothetical protein